ncbi:hypothetical protein L6164_032618 [Bauhinia variegata]|uniref:Uncharacterized protein n=1 Tax=Bauhinia variegata TaxID=167791 RepID=A0ACB9KQ24_BAUVA|nr:hypothetical protein L6164_032618 [Bauhinia variegata]
MAAAPFSIASDFDSSIQATNLTSIKTLSKSGLTTIPSSFASNNLHDLVVVDPSEAEIPIIDFSLLTSSNIEEKCKAIKDFGKALEEWGCFMLINHGIPESLINSMMEGIKGFFDMSDEEKREFQGKNVFDTIRCGSSFNTATEKVNCWRDFLKAFVHPEFHCPHKPAGFRETTLNYLGKIREVTKELLKGVSESLGLEVNYINKAVNVDSGLQILAANLYPPCPQPELAVGIHPHSDHGLLTVLFENGISGLQILHNGKWVKVHAPHNALMVNTADQLEIVTNGKYKSNIHRAVLYSNATRISVAIANGPSFEDIVSPAPDLVNESQPQAYRAITYREYFRIHQSNALDKKSALDTIRIQN